VLTESKSTTLRLLDRYNSYSRRATVREAHAREVIFESFRRTLGRWLPRDRRVRILDAACGEGALLCFLRDAGYSHLAGFDLSPENISICRQLGLDFVEQWDAMEYVEARGSHEFDVIFAMDMIEHLPKQQAAGFLERIRELLRPCGRLILQTPNMGSLLGCFHRHYDLSHEFGLTEKTALDLLMLAGFAQERVEIRPSWNATTPLGRLREVYLWTLHQAVFLVEGSHRPRIPTKNLLIRASVP
jgi:2-polyprenyl-3-methyl-5-hydroxy-6-metoxy-1,4-benzoquinol methylase